MTKRGTAATLAGWWSVAVLAGVLAAGCGDDDVVAPGVDAGPRVDLGPLRCTNAADCADTINCTTDTCVVATGVCRHVPTPALCGIGESCDPINDCVAGAACAIDADCADTNACTVNERCDPAARVCTFQTLDGDGDGDPPRVCGGTDCDDSSATVYLGAPELCNNIDDNCDSIVDEGFDFMNDSTHCGSCNTICDTGLTCSAGSCECTVASLTRCAGSSGMYCVDTDLTQTDCGTCGHACTGDCAGGICIAPYQECVDSSDCGSSDICVHVVMGGRDGKQCSRFCDNDAACPSVNGYLGGCYMFSTDPAFSSPTCFARCDSLYGDSDCGANQNCVNVTGPSGSDTICLPSI